MCCYSSGIGERKKMVAVFSSMQIGRGIVLGGKIVLTVFVGVGLIGGAIYAKPEELVEYPVSDNLRGHENIEWSTSYAFGLTDATRKQPRVLLVGDSICGGYKDGVRDELKGKMNVTYWISSYCVTSPGYLRLLSFYLDETEYAVVHFNNGLHSLLTPPADWEKGIRAALKLIRAKQPKARLVWASSTPLKDKAKTEKVKILNAIAAKVVAEMGRITTDDLFALMNPLDPESNWSDTYHFKPGPIAQQAKQVAASCLSVLSNGMGTGPASD